MIPKTHIIQYIFLLLLLVYHVIKKSTAATRECKES